MKMYIFLQPTRPGIPIPTGRHWWPLVCAVLISLCIVNSPTSAQYSAETFQLKRASEQYDERGFLKGQTINVDGKMAVSNANGGVSYSYTLDKFTQKGYSFSVDLNYCNSVTLSSFKKYNSGTAGGGPETPDYWDRFTRQHPMWIIGVNGFAVQTLSIAHDYMPPSNNSQPTIRDTAMPWLIEGYNFCNRMHRMEATGQYDVINLLRSDGSLLELRHPYQFGVDTYGGGPVVEGDLSQGSYFEDAINATGCARVVYDTVYIRPELLNEVRLRVAQGQQNGDPNYWKLMLHRYLPRRVYYYPGDGLEYVFIEQQITYGTERFYGDQSTTGGTAAGPTIFYLKEINDASGVVLNLEYSRHMTPDDGTIGRAPIKKIGEYIEFGYGASFVTVQAHSRTTSLQLENKLNLHLFASVGGERFKKASPIGMVEAIRDPENRVTEFGYENYTRYFMNYNHPYTINTQLITNSRRLTSIKEPSARYSITYYEESNKQTWYQANATPPAGLADWKLNNAARQVQKRDQRGALLTTESYCFDGMATSNPGICNTQILGSVVHTIHTVKDEKTQQQKTITYSFMKMEVPRYRAMSAPHPLAVPLTFTAPVGTVEEADGRAAGSSTAYAAIPNSAYIMPSASNTSVSYSSTPGAITSSVSYSYETNASGYGWQGPSAVAQRHLRKVTKRTETVKNPATGAPLLYNVIEYLHLPLLLSPQTIAQVSWDKFASQKLYLAMRAAGQLPCCWEDMPDSLHVFDTLSTRDFVAPPFYDLERESYQLSVGGQYLGGMKRVHEETSRAPGSNRRGLPLCDSSIAENRASSVLVAEYKYGTQMIPGGGFGTFYSSERLSAWQKNANGSVAEMLYPFSLRDERKATLLNDDGTTKQQVLSDRAMTLGLEKPLQQRNLVRNARTGGTDTLKVNNEWTFYGLQSAVGDMNGYYSRFQYDANGRLVKANLPKDFLGSLVTCTERFDGKKTYQTPDFWTQRQTETRTVHCPDGGYIGSSYNHSTDGMVLDAGLSRYPGPCPISYIAVSSGLVAPGTDSTRADEETEDESLIEQSTSGKRGRETVLNTAGNRTFLAELRDTAFCYFETQGLGSLFGQALTLRGGTFKFYITAMEGNCFAMSVVVRRRSDSSEIARRRYVMNCPTTGALSTSKKGSALYGGTSDNGSKRDTELPSVLDDEVESLDYLFPVPFKPQEVQTMKQAGAAGLLVEIVVHTWGARIAIDNSEDKRPFWELDGVFDIPTAQDQYTLSFQYPDNTDQTIIQRSKTDDRYTSINFPNGSCRPMRYSEMKNELMADRLEKVSLAIGDPTQPIRTDSTRTTYTGFGKAVTVRDQEAYTTITAYDTWGRPLQTTNPDGSYSTMEYSGGDPVVLTGDNTQDFYSFCERTLTQIYDSISGNRRVCAARYFDAWGRLRREIQDTLHKQETTTKYEYDERNRLITVTNPNSTVTQYWYDEYGRVKYKHQPDMGYTSYAYDAVGNARFIQSQEQANNGRIGFTQYDDLGRATLIGEARLGEGGGGHGGGGIALRNGGTGTGSKRETRRETVLTNPPAGRLTDQINARVLQDGGISTAVTANKTVWLTPSSSLPQFWALTYLTETTCTPQPIIGPVAPPYLVHPVAQYNDPGLPLATATTFENISQYPQNARIAIQYDALPVPQGSVWQHFPAASRWNALTPNGVVRNTKGHEIAVAYRQHAGEPYHFVVMSYDERGRVEALLRYTENLGFDAVYYAYNALNAVTSIRVADPLRQYTTWYSYDWNGRVDSVWTKLSNAGNGLGVANPVCPPVDTRPTQPDIVYTYTKRGQVAEMKYPPVNTIVSYLYNPRALLDSMRTQVNGAQAFVQAFEYTGAAQLAEQRWQHAGQNPIKDTYGYNEFSGRSQGFLTGWAHNAGSTNEDGEFYSYDNAGNRVTSAYWNPSQNDYRGRAYKYTDPSGPNRLTAVRDSVLQNNVWVETGYTNYSYNANGTMTSRTAVTGTNTISEAFAYDGLQNLLKKYVRTQGPSVDDWRYRYGAAGEREQKRLYSTTQRPAREWTYYLLDGMHRQLAVYEGIETQYSSCGQSFGDAPVYLSASEYNTFGQGNSSIHNLTTRPITSTTSRKEYTVQDYLGTTRLVVKPDGMGRGVITGRYDYAPYGKLLWSNAQENRKGWIDKEKDDESGLRDFGARKYDDGIGRFISIDPYWELYPSLSLYQYAANNPLTLKDPGGKLIEWQNFGEDRQWAMDEYNAAIDYLQANGATDAAAILVDIRDNPNYTVNVRVEKTDMSGNDYELGTNTIHWSSRAALEVDNAHLSPAELLAHEGDHAQKAHKDKVQFIKDTRYDSDNPYETKEEERVIKGTESTTARQLNHLKDPNKSNSRESHGAIKRYKVESVGGITPAHDNKREEKKREEN